LAAEQNFPSDKNAQGKDLAAPNQQTEVRSIRNKRPDPAKTKREKQKSHQQEAKITSSLKSQLIFSIEISADLLRMKEVFTLSPSFDYLDYKILILTH
jgi:hypothetical protein